MAQLGTDISDIMNTSRETEIDGGNNKQRSKFSVSICLWTKYQWQQTSWHPPTHSVAGVRLQPSPLTTNTGAGEWEHPHGSHHPVWASHLSDFLSQGDGLTGRNPPTHAPPHTEGPSGQVSQKGFSMGVLTWHLHFESSLVLKTTYSGLSLPWPENHTACLQFGFTSLLLIF